MDWFKQNPFNGGLLVVTALLVLGAGYFAYNAQTSLAEQEQLFDEQSQQLSNLRATQPFPNAANLAAAEVELKKAQDLVNSFSETVKQRSAELAGVTPQAFQDDLRSKVNEVIKRAAQAGIELETGFYLGFEKYETQLPEPKAAPLLTQQLASINGVVNALLEARVSNIGAITRTPLPVEGPQAPAEPKGGGRKKADGAGLELVNFNIVFTAEQSAAREALNGIVSSKPMVLVRMLGVTNSATEGPSKKDGAGAPEPQISAEGEAASSAIPPVLGRESVTVAMRLASISTAAPKTQP